MITTLKEVPFLVFDVKDHASIKANLVHSIKSMGEFSFNNDNQRISHTDWHLSPTFPRDYFRVVEPVLLETCANIKDSFDFSERLAVVN